MNQGSGEVNCSFGGSLRLAFGATPLIGVAGLTDQEELHHADHEVEVSIGDHKAELVRGGIPQHGQGLAECRSGVFRRHYRARGSLYGQNCVRVSFRTVGVAAIDVLPSIGQMLTSRCPRIGSRYRMLESGRHLRLDPALQVVPRRLPKGHDMEAIVTSRSSINVVKDTEIPNSVSRNADLMVGSVTTMARIGRPPSENPRKRLVAVHVTEAEHAVIREWASKENRSLSDLMRIVGVALSSGVRNPGAVVESGLLPAEDVELVYRLIGQVDGVKVAKRVTRPA